MANPKFRSGPITFQAGAALDQFRLVKLDENGKVVYAAAADNPHGVVTEQAAPATDRAVNDLSLGLPENIAVHLTGVVAVATDAEFTTGAAVYAAAEGKAATSGTVVVGWAAGPTSGGRVPVVLQLPAQA